MVIFPLAPDQTIDQMWSNGACNSPCCFLADHGMTALGAYVRFSEDTQSADLSSNEEKVTRDNI